MINFTKKIDELTFTLNTDAGADLTEMIEAFDTENSVYDLALAKWIIVCQTAVGSAYKTATEKGDEFTNEDAQAVVDKLEMHYARGKKADPVAKASKLLDGLSEDVRAAILAKYKG